MTIDEAIEFSRYKASQQYSELYDYEYDAEEHEQLAEWLEELKELRKFKNDFTDLGKLYSEIRLEERNKAIDDFILKAEEERDNIYNWDEDEYENGMRTGYQYSIEIAEQLKDGE